MATTTRRTPARKVTAAHAQPATAVARAPMTPEPVDDIEEFEEEEPKVRTTVNAWWCPDDDRAMTMTNPPTPCDVCGRFLADF